MPEFVRRRDWSGALAVFRPGDGWTFGGKVALAAVTLLGLLLRLAMVGKPVQNDEAATVLDFVVVPVIDTLSLYTPNNHLLNSFLTKVCVHFFGLTPVTIRLPALVAGVLAVPLTGLLGARLFSERAGLIAAAVVAACPFAIYYSVCCRGYSLQGVCFLAASLAAAEFVRRARTSGTVSLGALAAYTVFTWLGFMALPTMVYGSAGIGIWVVAVTVLEWRRRCGPVLVPFLVANAIAGALTVIGHAGVFVRVGVRYFLSNPWTQPKPLPVFLDEIRWPLLSFWEGFTAGMPPLPWVLLCLPALAAFVPRASREQGRVPALACVLVATASVMTAQRGIVPARAFVFVIPVLALALGAGWARLLEALAALVRGRERSGAQAACVVLACLCGIAGLRNVGSVHELELGAEYPPGPTAATVVMEHVRAGEPVFASSPEIYYIPRFHLRLAGIDHRPFLAPWHVPQMNAAFGETFWILADTRKDPRADLVQQMALMKLDAADWRIFEAANTGGAGLFRLEKR